MLAGRKKKWRLVWGLAVAVALSVAGVPTGFGGLTGRILIAGYGPELPVMQELARAFEKSHPGTAIDFEWDKTVKAVDLVKSGEAQVAVTDQPDPALKMTPIAWDGIAVIVNFANPVKELTSTQVKDLFTGKITRWSDLEGGGQAVEVLPRAVENNVQFGFEASLGITGQVRASGKPVKTDEKALRAVSGRDRAITYISLSAALKAQEDGIPIRILTIDKVDPGPPTVKSGEYKLRRPVLLLTAKQPDALTQAFVAFAQSSEGRRILQSTFIPHTPGTFEVKFPPARLADDPDSSTEKQPS